MVDAPEALDENQLSKAVRAGADAVTGRDREIPAREPDDTARRPLRNSRPAATHPADMVTGNRWGRV